MSFYKLQESNPSCGLGVKGSQQLTSYGTIAEHILEYLEHPLNQLISQNRLYTKDSSHILYWSSTLEEIMDGTLLCIVNAAQLYLKIFYTGKI